MMKRTLLAYLCGSLLATGVCEAESGDAQTLEALKQQLKLLQDQVTSLEQKLSRNEVAVQKAVENVNSQKAIQVAQQAPSDGKSFMVDKTKVKIGGFFKLVGIQDISGSSNAWGGDGGASGRNALRALAIGLDGDKSAPSRDLYLHARESRLAINTETNSGEDTIKTCIETDFVGDPTPNQVTSNGYVPRLRRAWGSYKGFLVGQEWSVFSNTESAAETIDSSGQVGQCKLRQVQARYTKKLGNYTLDFALENPETEFITERGKQCNSGSSKGSSVYTDGIKGENRIPELTCGIRYGFDRGMIRLAGLLKQNTVFNERTRERAHAGGGALALCGLLNITDGDQLTMKLGIGSGCGRYFIEGVNTSTYYDGSSLNNQKEYHVSFGLKHRWTKKYNLRSNLAFGYLRLDNSDALKRAITARTITPDFASKINKEIMSVHANLMADVNEKVTVGLEYIYAKRKAESGKKIGGTDEAPELSKDSGKLQRLTFCAQFNL